MLVSAQNIKVYWDWFRLLNINLWHYGSSNLDLLVFLISNVRGGLLIFDLHKNCVKAVVIFGSNMTPHSFQMTVNFTQFLIPFPLCQHLLPNLTPPLSSSRPPKWTVWNYAQYLIISKVNKPSLTKFMYQTKWRETKLHVQCALWQYGSWSFQTRSTKLERFLPKNQHTQRKLLNFENWISGGLGRWK